MKRAALLFCCLALSAQTPEPSPEPNEESRQALLQWNTMARVGNEWRNNHNSMLWSKADHERLKKFEAESRKFFRLAKEAQF